MCAAAVRPTSDGAGRGAIAGEQDVPLNMKILEPRRPHARMRLVCFPWAGGEGPAEYTAMNWAQQFPDFIEVVAFRWSGRGTRQSEPVWKDFSWIPGEIRTCLEFLAEKPFALFGHSMGSSTAYEFARWLTLNGSVRPIHLFFSGTVPPQHHRRLPTMSLAGLSREVQVAKLEYLSGMSAKHLKRNNYELFNIVMPVIEPDLKLADYYRGHCRRSTDQQPVLQCNITAFVGDSDEMNTHRVKDWRAVTSGTTRVRKFPGGHFYFKKPKSNLPVLAMCVTSELTGTAVVSKL